MRFLRQKYWSGLPFPSPVDLPNPGIEPMSPALQADFFYHRATRKKDCSGLYSVSRNLFIMCLIIPPHLSSVLFPSSSHIPSSGNYSGCKWETHNFHWLLVFKGTSFPVCLFGLWRVGVGKDLHMWGFGFLQFYPELHLQCLPLHTWGSICTIWHRTTVLHIRITWGALKSTDVQDWLHFN